MSHFAESQVLREKAGQPTGGQFAEKARAASGVSLDQPDEGEVRLRAAAQYAGWPIVADVLMEMREDGDLTGSAADSVTDSAIIEAGDTIFGPAIDDAEAWLAESYAADRPSVTAQALAEAWAEGHRTGWEHCQDGNYGNDHWDDPTPNPYAAPVALDTDRLRGVCQEAGVPSYVVSFIEAADDRGEVPTTYLNSLDSSDLAHLHADVIEPRMSEFAGQLRPSAEPTDLAA